MAVTHSAPGNANTLPEDGAISDDPGGITRRDFVGGTLVGAGAALLGMAAPASRTAQAQTVASKMTGLGPDWTGPGQVASGTTADRMATPMKW